MADPLLSRAHLEALCIAIARVNADFTQLLLASLDRDRVSPSCWALLEKLDDSNEYTWIRSKGEQKLTEYAGSLTNDEMVEFPPATLIALVNALPARIKPPAAWERHLQSVTEASAA